MSVEVDWSLALDQVGSSGTAYVKKALGQPLLTELLALDVAWKQLDEQLPSGVYQQYAFASVDPQSNRLVKNLCVTIRDGLLAADESRFGLGVLELNEASLHRYASTDAGLGRHRDMDFYRLLVVGITLEGSGELHLFDDEAALIQIWNTEPGDLYLFRAPDFGGHNDGRPAHATGPTNGRTSLTLRYNQHGFGGGW